jgi:DNA-directed RNA polymerase subunit RPC12/RpoP
MLEGECPRCGQKYYGLALSNPRYQTCARCGAGLNIKDGDKVIKGFSPFSADSVRIKPEQKKKSGGGPKDN